MKGIAKSDNHPIQLVQLSRILHIISKSLTIGFCKLNMAMQML